MQPLIALIGLGVVALVGALTYWPQPLPPQPERVVLESLPDASLTPSPEPTTPSPTALPASTARVQNTPVPTVAAATTTKPTPSKSAVTPKPTASATPTPHIESAATTNVAIQFINLPETVRAGESFKVAWRIVGPSGVAGSNTTLTTRYHATQNKSNVNSSTKSDTSNSFGSFTIPASFSSTFSFGNEPATIAVTVTADVDGKTIKAERNILLVE